MSRLWSWLLDPCGSVTAAPVTTESFGNAQLPSSQGEELLSETPERSRYRAAIRDLMGDLDRARKRELVDRVLVRFALWVVDLPASEAHHDSRPGGLLDHSLKVTHAVAQALSNSTLRLSYDPVEDTRERPLWIYAGFVSALLHDVGKLYDLEVSSPNGKETWNPQAEPLAAFLGRWGLKRTPTALYRFLPGRGLKAHKGRSPIFQPLILPPEANAYSGKRLPYVTEAYVESAQGELPPHIPEAARQVAALIRAWDKEEATLPRPESRKSTESAAPSQPVPKPEAAPEPQAVEAKPSLEKAFPPPSAMPQRPVPSIPSSGTLPPDRKEEEPLLVIPGEDLWGRSALGLDRDLTAERLLYILTRLTVSGRLSARGDSAAVFIRPDYTWFRYPAALEVAAKSERFTCRPDLRTKMLVMLARAGILAPFGPERYLAHVRTTPTAKQTVEVFRLSTSAVLDGPNRASMDLWPHEIKIDGRAEAGTGSGESAA